MKKLAGFLAVCLLVLIGSQNLVLSQTCPVATQGHRPDYPYANFWCPAKYFTSGRQGHTIKYIVIHTLLGSLQSGINCFYNPDNFCLDDEGKPRQVSAHYLIGRDGSIIQMVHEGDTAWHAGNWQYNLESIGIEHEGFVTDPNWATEEMYQASARLVRYLVDKYGIPLENIIGHNQVPDPYEPGKYGGAGNHYDPCNDPKWALTGERCNNQYWKWDYFMQLVRGGSTTPVPDSDNDGVPDSQDRCPYEAGPSWNGGCPLPPVTDSDNDGIPDGQDRCPYEWGPAWNNGCPEQPPISPPPGEQDSDRDGISDDQDACPYEPGPSWNNGCPEVPLPTNQPPIASFTFSPINPSIDQPVRFDASSSFDPDPSDYIAEYRWDFNDDRIIDAHGPIVYHTFSFGASYQVTLIVVDSRGAASFQRQVISVSGSTTPPPPPDIGPSPEGDFDHDGIPDSQDRCPYEPGPRESNGCPDSCQMDSDRDGVSDCWDRCPNTPPGTQVDEFGCPVASAPFIKNWLLCGPFPYSPGTEQSAHDNNFIGETTVQPRAGDACGRGVWQAHYGIDDYIDFNNIFTPNEYTVAYAHVYINSPRTQNVQLRLGSDDSIKAWLNGSLVHNNYILRPPAQDQDIVNVTLNAGWNRLLIKVLEVGGDWGFYARFTNTDGSEVQGLTYQLDNPTPSRRDSDGDGIPDSQDRCPYQPGPSWNGGCPEDTGPPPPPEGDSDHDGIPDSQDRCPYQAGPSWNGGCPEDTEPPPPPLPPVADSDHDGIPDDQDRCPYQAGPGWNDGCPVSSPPPPSSGSKTIEAALDTNGNGILDDDEILRALQYWSSGEEVPGTDGQTIDDAKMLELLHIWASRRPISSASAQSGPIQIGRAESLTVREIKLSPNPVKSTHPATFRAEGSGIAGIKVEVFNLEGMKVFEEEESGNTLRFYAVDNRGRPLANGVYLYVVRVRGFDGREYVSEVRKLVILR